MNALKTPAENVTLIKKSLLPGLLVFLAGLIVFYRIASDRSSAMMYIFQARDLARAQETAAGALYLWGPEMTGGGTLPGGFYYWMMSLPFLLGMGWEGNWYLLAATWAVGWLVFFNLLRRIAGWQAAWLGLTIFLPPLIYINFLNSSMAPVCSLLGAVGIVGTYAGKNEKLRGRAWLLGCVAIGFGMQLHFSIATYLIGGIILNFLARRLRLPVLSASVFRLGLFGFLLPMLPYAVYLAARQLGTELGVPAPQASGSLEEALPSLLHLAQGALAEISALVSVRRFFVFVPIPLLAGLICISVVPLRSLERRAFYRLRRIWLPLLLLSLLSLIPAGYFVIRPIGIRYLAPFTISVIPLTCILYRFVVTSRSRTAIYVFLNVAISFFILSGVDDWRFVAAVSLLFFFGIIFLVSDRKARRNGRVYLLALLLAGFASHKQGTYKALLPEDIEQPMPRVEQLEDLAEHIIEQTGWSYEQARERLFFINTHKGFSIRHIYDARYEALQTQIEARVAPELTDGYLVIFRGRDDGIKASAALKDWLVRQEIQADLRQGLADGGIRLGSVQSFRSMLLMPYQVTNLDKYPQKFQNTGHAYEKNPANEVFTGLAGQQGVRALADGSILFHWSSCAEIWCSTGALVSYRKGSSRLEMKVKITGAPLEQVSLWTGPGWGQLWLQPYLRVQCRGEPVTVPLVSSLGINMQYVRTLEGMSLSYSSFLGPIERKFSVPCSGALNEIKVGRHGTTTYHSSGPVDSPATELVYSAPKAPAKM